MTRIINKWVLYFVLLTAVYFVVDGSAYSLTRYLLLAGVLAVLNIILRPIIAIIAGALGIVTMGLPILFINLPTLYLSNAISGNTMEYGFWMMFLVSILLFSADWLHSQVFKKYRPMRAR